MNLRNVARIPLGLIAGLLGLALSVPAALILLPFGFTGLMTGTLRRLLEPRLVEWEDVIDFVPQVGWRPKPNLDVHVRDFNSDTYHVTTGPDGWRGHHQLAEADVVAIGDSYAFGCGVDDADFFAHQGGDLRIKSVGSPAYSMVHSVLWMERLAPELRDKLVVWFVYHGNDLADNLHPALLHYRSPFARSNPATGDWEIAAEHVDQSRWTVNSREGEMQAFIEICSPTHQSVRAFEACEFLIRRGAEVCRDAGAKLVVVSIPDLSHVARLALARALEQSEHADHFDEDRPDRELKAISDRAGIPFMALRDHMDEADYLERDFHWNPRGNRKVARLIEDLSRSSALEDDSTPSVSEPVARRVSAV